MRRRPPGGGPAAPRAASPPWGRSAAAGPTRLRGEGSAVALSYSFLQGIRVIEGGGRGTNPQPSAKRRKFFSGGATKKSPKTFFSDVFFQKMTEKHAKRFFSGTKHGELIFFGSRGSLEPPPSAQRGWIQNSPPGPNPPTLPPVQNQRSLGTLGAYIWLAFDDCSSPRSFSRGAAVGGSNQRLRLRPRILSIQPAPRPHRPDLNWAPF